MTSDAKTRANSKWREKAKTTHKRLDRFIPIELYEDAVAAINKVLLKNDNK